MIAYCIRLVWNLSNKTVDERKKCHLFVLLSIVPFYVVDQVNINTSQ